MALDSPERIPTGRAEHRMARVAGAALLVIAAGLHIYEYFGASPLSLAALFIASAAGTVAGAVLLLAKAPRLGWLIGGVASALTFAAYCITRTIGIPGVDPSADIGYWLQPLGVVSLIVEAGALLLAVIALSDRHNLSTHRARAELAATIPGRAEVPDIHR
ncbi:MAG: hypothetical protein DLM62_17020 [Pseudonocardiales bacterium]|nr:MAG: hypothetical protein DLM62_17020 [Pseudonocardiales bacterium]